MHLGATLRSGSPAPNWLMTFCVVLSVSRSGGSGVLLLLIVPSSGKEKDSLYQNACSGGAFGLALEYNIH